MAHLMAGFGADGFQRPNFFLGGLLFLVVLTARAGAEAPATDKSTTEKATTETKSASATSATPAASASSVTVEGEEPSAPVPAGTHKQARTITPAKGERNWKLATFCLTGDGRIVAVLSRPEPTGVVRVLGSATKNASEPKSDDADSTSAAKPAPAQVRVLSAAGEPLEQFDLDFLAQAVNVCPDGQLVLGGDGVLARYDMSGKELARAESPHILASRKDPEAVKVRAKELLEEQQKSIAEHLKQLEEQKAKLAEKDEAALTPEERQSKPQLDEMIKAYQQMVERRGDKPIAEGEIERMAKQLESMGRRVNAVAANGKYLFFTAPASKGYGYSVWRANLDFSDAQRIADGLSGCCGQMDIQCCDNEVVVAENSRKRVVRFDAEGKKLGAWGKGSRDGAGDTFGSCCNPMNTRFASGKLLVSDSDGRVRLFSLDGNYEGEVGKANVRPGCKSSIVDVSPDGNSVYYIDVNNSAICVLERKSAESTAAQ